MYTIGEASTRSGVGVSLIRAWERRYGLVKPARTDSGYRLYDDATIAILRAMRGLIEGGWHASQAARAIAAGDIPIDFWATRPFRPPSSRSDPPGAAPNRAGEAPVEAFVRAAAAYDASGVEGALNEMFSRGSFEAVIEELVMPAAVALGARRAAGTVDVLAEHHASGAVARRLGIALDSAGRPASDPPVIIGLPPDSRHELGALSFAVGLRRRGVGVLYLGPDVPVPSWVDAVATTSARVAVLGVVTTGDVAAAGAVRTALRRWDPSLLVALGGSAAADVAAKSNDRLTIVLPHRVMDAVAVVAKALEEPAADEGHPTA